MRFTFRPLEPQHRGGPTAARRHSPFRAGWDNTRRLLVYELAQLAARNVVVQIDVAESDLRLDGTGPLAKAHVASPTVVLAFESTHGPLKYVSETFDRWPDNLRAIALGLESLRRVDRYGITRRGEQYAGWRALPAGADDELIARGEHLIRLAPGGLREALRETHPDAGGDPDDFRAVIAARDAMAA